MLKKILFKLQVFFETTKSLLVRAIVTILIICFIGAIIHNVLKMSEISSNYKGEYKKLISIDDNKMMNVYDTGSGSKTIVILPGFGSQSPIIQYKTLVEELNDSYRVIVLEYYGYGYSMNNTGKERTNSVIASEINTALNTLGVDKCVFIAHSISNLYASKYVSLYPERVEGIISLDGLYPSEIQNSHLKQRYQDQVKNIKLTGVLELTGFARVLSYVKPDMFYIDVMQSSGYYDDADIKVYRNRIGSSYLTTTMIKEISKLEENMKELATYKYPDYLPVLQILSKDRIKEYDEMKSQTNKTLKEFANDMVSNSSVQTNVEIEGDHMLQLTAVSETVSSIKNFLITF